MSIRALTSMRRFKSTNISIIPTSNDIGINYFINKRPYFVSKMHFQLLLQIDIHYKYIIKSQHNI